MIDLLMVTSILSQKLYGFANINTKWLNSLTYQWFYNIYEQWILSHSYYPNWLNNHG